MLLHVLEGSYYNTDQGRMALFSTLAVYWPGFELRLS